jgi:transketolase
MRELFIKQLVKEAEKNKKIILIVGDLGYGIVEPFKIKFPDRFYNAGVAEQSMAGLASGLALKGYHVFIYSIANFSTFRCAEQIRNDIDYHNLSVTIVSVGSGVGYGNLGYSHHCLQDYALLRSLPNTVIAAPSNNQELIESLKYLFNNPQSSYLRLDKSLNINSIKKVPLIKPGKWIFYKNKKSKNIIISTGTVAANCESILKSKSSYNWATIPMWSMQSKRLQFKKIKKYRNIITIENHLQDGGCGSWLNESLAQEENEYSKTNIISKFLSSKIVGKVGNDEYLNKKYGIK